MKRAAIYTPSAIARDHDERERSEDYIAKMGWHWLRSTITVNDAKRLGGVSVGITLPPQAK